MSVDRQPIAAAFSVTGDPSSTSEQGTLCLVAHSAGSALRLFLQRVAGGLYVEREEIPRHGTRICQSLHFSDRAGFEQWCDDDPARFEHPLLHARLKRDGDALWRTER